MGYRLSSLLATVGALALVAAVVPQNEVRAAQAAPGAPAQGQPGAPPGLSIGDNNIQSVAAVVNDHVISEYDLNQRMALFIATSGLQAPSKEALAQLRPQILRALEDETLQLQEAAKHKIVVKTGDVDAAVKQVAQDNNLTGEQITATLRTAGVSITTFRNQLTAQIAWQHLIEARYAGTVQVSDEQVDAALARIKNGADKPQFAVSEIFLGLDKPEDDEKVKTAAQQIIQQLNLGAVFPTVAGQFSQAPSAAGGGDIGWVIQGQLPAELDNTLKDMQPGQIAGPIKSEGGYYIVLLRDRLEPVGTQQVEVPKPDPSAPIPVDRLLLQLPPGAPPELVKQAMDFAEQMRPRIRNCGDLPDIAKAVNGALFTLGNIKPGDLAKEFTDAILATPPGGVAQPIRSDAGVELFVRCDPAIRKVTPFVMPTRDDMFNQIFTQQMTVLARSYLRDLRRDSVVETR